MLKRTLRTGLAVVLVLTVATPALAYNYWTALGGSADWWNASNWRGDGIANSAAAHVLIGWDGYRDFDPDLGATNAEILKFEIAGGYTHLFTISGTGTLTVHDSLGSYQGNVTIVPPLNIVNGGAPRLTAGVGTTFDITHGINLVGATYVIAGSNQQQNVNAGTVRLDAVTTGSAANWLLYGGTLMVTNPSGSATGSGPIDIDSGTTIRAILTGTGTVGTGASYLHNSGGTIAPGLSIGTLHANVTNFAFMNGSTLDIQTDGTTLDLLAITGDLILDPVVGGTYNNTLNVTGPGTMGPFLTYTGTRTGTFATEIVPVGFVVDYATHAGQVWLIEIPEPATLALLGLSGLGLLLRRKQH